MRRYQQGKVSRGCIGLVERFWARDRNSYADLASFSVCFLLADYLECCLLSSPC